MPLYFRQAGSGEPVLLIHGLFGSSDNLGALARPLAENFQVYSLDLPNHGKSPHTLSTALPELAESVGIWLDEQGINQISLIGHSLGGKVAMELALLQPQKVHKLVVMDIAPVAYTHRQDAVFAGLISVDQQTPGSRKEAEDILSEHVMEPAVRSFLLKNLQRDEEGKLSWRINLPVLYDDYEKLLMANSHAVFDAPVLFIKGEHSEYLQAACSPEIEQRFPRAKLKMVSETGHWLHAEKPVIVASMVKEFLLE